MQAKSEIKIRLGKTLGKWRTQKSYNYEELARKSEVSSSFIKNIEYGKALNCSVKYWNKILKPLDKTYDDLLIETVLDYLSEISHPTSPK